MTPFRSLPRAARRGVRRRTWKDASGGCGASCVVLEAFDCAVKMSAMAMLYAPDEARQFSTMFVC